MKHKLPAILICFLLLGLFDDFMAFNAPVNWRLQTFSLVPHFFYLGMLLYVYNKEAVTRLLCGILAGLVWDWIFAGTFPYGVFWFGLTAWLSGFVPMWTNSTAGWSWFVLMAFLMDLVPYLVLKASFPDYPDFFAWIWKMETFTLLMDTAAVFTLRYGADVMNRYFILRDARIRREKRLKEQSLQG